MAIERKEPHSNFNNIYYEQSGSRTRVNAIWQIVHEKGEEHGINPDSFKVLHPGEYIYIVDYARRQVNQVLVNPGNLGIRFDWDGKNISEFWELVRARERDLEDAKARRD